VDCNIHRSTSLLNTIITAVTSLGKYQYSNQSLQVSLVPAEKQPTISVSISVTPQIQTFINTKLINRKMCFSHVLQETNSLD